MISTGVLGAEPLMTAAARMRGASLTGVIAIVLVATRVSTPSVTVVVKVRGAVLLRAGEYATRPSVLKYAVNAVGEPVRIRAVGVPVTVTPPAVAAIARSRLVVAPRRAVLEVLRGDGSPRDVDIEFTGPDGARRAIEPLL